MQTLVRQRELTICPNYSLDNRWKLSDDTVNYTVIERFQIGRMLYDDSNLRRLKICRLPAVMTDDYLSFLSQKNRLEQLELEQLELVRGKTPEWRFNALLSLSIDTLTVVDDRSRITQRYHLLTKCKISAPYLALVQLGR